MRTAYRSPAPRARSGFDAVPAKRAEDKRHEQEQERLEDGPTQRHRRRGRRFTMQSDASRGKGRVVEHLRGHDYASLGTRLLMTKARTRSAAPPAISTQVNN